MYGKPRVTAEAFTSFDLTWNEHPDMLKRIADIHLAEGVTHLFQPAGLRCRAGGESAQDVDN